MAPRVGRCRPEAAAHGHSDGARTAIGASRAARRSSCGRTRGRHEPDNGKIPGLVFYGAPGDLVQSATAGEVKWAATVLGTRGKVVIIKSADGTLFTYGGNAELLVNVGDRVSPGTDIAKLGESPQGGGAKLYFSISDAKWTCVDPEKFFSAKSQS